MFKERSLALSLRLAFGGGVAGVALVSVPAFAQEVQRGSAKTGLRKQTEPGLPTVIGQPQLAFYQ